MGNIDILAEIQNGETSITMLHKESNEILIGKGVRQELSLKKFTASLEEIFRHLDEKIVPFRSVEANFQI